MSENDNKPENFVQWVNINFSKPYLIFILWWIIINIDFVLILMGKTHIWTEINDKYNMLKTVLGITPKSNSWLYFFLYNLIFPLVGTFITIVGISSIMNSFKMLSNWVDDIFKHWNDDNVQKRLSKQENKIKDLKTRYKSMSKEFQEKIDTIEQCNLFLYKENFYENIQKIDLTNNEQKNKKYEQLNLNYIFKLRENNNLGFIDNSKNIHLNMFNSLKEYDKLLSEQNREYNSEVEKLHNIKDLFDKNEKVIIETFLMNLKWRDRFHLMKTIFKKKKKKSNKNKEISA